MNQLPVRTIVLGYLALVAVGTVFILLTTTRPLSLLDATFTAVSALTVTGLTVVNTAEHFGIAGQWVLLALIQVGGLGWVTLALGTAMALGKRPGLMARLHLQEERAARGGDVVQLCVQVFRIAAICQGVGALLLAVGFSGDLPWERAVWWGIFHAVSAFNNAGFDLTGRSFVGWQNDWIVQLSAAGLIIAGGLGFGVLAELASSRLLRRLSPHTTMVLVVSGILLLVGTVGLYSLERHRALAGLSEGQRWLVAFFQSAASRTAGFHSVPMSTWSPAALFMLMVLMFVGASPGSTGGGIRTTTLGVLVLSLWQYARGDTKVQFARWQVPEEAIRKGLLLLVASVGLVTLSTFILLVADPDLPPLALLFEVVSAVATVGLSTGVTPELSPVSKVVLMVCMSAGKLGILSVLRLSFVRRESRVQYPTAENLIVG